MTLHVQFLTMLMMILGGFYLGVALDTFRRFSWHWKHNVFLKYFLEICFWLSQSLILFYFLYHVNAGELRLYIFLSCLLGFAAYKALAASFYKQLLEIFIRILRGIYHLFERIVQLLIISPIKWIFRVIFSVTLWVIQLIFTILFWLLKVLLYPIKGFLKFIYQRLPKRFQDILYKFAGFYSTIKNICIKVLQYITFKRR